MQCRTEESVCLTATDEPDSTSNHTSNTPMDVGLPQYERLCGPFPSPHPNSNRPDSIVQTIPNCQTKEKSFEAEAATKAVLGLRKQRDEAESRLMDVRRPKYAKGAAFAEVFHGEPSYFGALPVDIVSYCKRELGLSPGICEGKHKKFLSRVMEIYMQSETLISQAEAEFTRRETLLRKRCRNVPEGVHGCGGIARD